MLIKIESKLYTKQDIEKTISNLISIIESYLNKTSFIEMYEDTYRYDIEQAKKLLEEIKK